MQNVGVFLIPLSSEKIHVFEYALSRIRNNKVVFNDVEVPYAEVLRVINNYTGHKLFEQILQAFNVK